MQFSFDFLGFDNVDLQNLCSAARALNIYKHYIVHGKS